MSQRIAVGLTTILTSGVAAQFFKALWLYSSVPQGVTLIAVIMAMLVGVFGWVKWLKYLRLKQLQEAQALQQETESFSYFVREELVERQLDLTLESRKDLQTQLLRFDQGLPIALSVLGVVLGLM